MAAPEELLDTSITEIFVGGHRIHAYSLQRIAGEKLRAFLSSLPTYRAKVKKPGNAVRVRDLYDIAGIRRTRDLIDAEFWLAAGREFQVACQSRYIDCAGLETFQENWEVTRKSYEEATIPKDIPFAEAEETMKAIVAFFIHREIIPFMFMLPENP